MTHNAEKGLRPCVLCGHPRHGMTDCGESVGYDHLNGDHECGCPGDELHKDPWVMERVSLALDAIRYADDMGLEAELDLLAFAEDVLRRYVFPPAETEGNPTPSAEKDAPDEGCTCAEIAEVTGFRLTDSTIMALCDRLRPRVLPPATCPQGHTRVAGRWCEVCGQHGSHHTETHPEFTCCTPPETGDTDD